MNRREALGVMGGVALAGAGTAAPDQSSNGMIYRTLGKTGERVSAIGLGGYHIGVPKDPQESIRLVRSAVDRGMNFMDNCWDYHDGESERRMGQALRDGYRQKVFLMTKFDGRELRPIRTTATLPGALPVKGDSGRHRAKTANAE